MFLAVRVYMYRFNKDSSIYILSSEFYSISFAIKNFCCEYIYVWILYFVCTFLCGYTIFHTGRSQLTPLEIEETRKIANLRIHVERVIGSMRQKYTILQSILPIDMLRVNNNGLCSYDKITYVCCILVNLCSSMVRS